MQISIKVTELLLSNIGIKARGEDIWVKYKHGVELYGTNNNMTHTMIGPYHNIKSHYGGQNFHKR